MRLDRRRPLHCDSIANRLDFVSKTRTTTGVDPYSIKSQSVSNPTLIDILYNYIFFNQQFAHGEWPRFLGWRRTSLINLFLLKQSLPPFFSLYISDLTSRMLRRELLLILCWLIFGIVFLASKMVKAEFIWFLFTFLRVRCGVHTRKFRHFTPYWTK